MNHSILRELHTLLDFVRWGASRFNEAQLFFGHGTDNAVDEAIVLIRHALHLPRDIPEQLWQANLTYPEKQAVLNLLQRRIQERLPAPYLTHEAWFANLRFYVDPRVLIPRSPIAELIEQQFHPWINAHEVNHMLDLCTGSGCIAIASALLVLPNAVVDAVDFSQEALAVAHHNIANYGLEHRINLIFSDLFSDLEAKFYDLIVCNPPYADTQELQAMPDEYQHEPKIGLAGGEDGLQFVRKILRDAPKYLTDHGVLIVEVGASQSALVAQYPNIPFIWLEFKHGGEGVFLLTAQQLKNICIT